LNSEKGNSWDHTYSEADWNPITEEQALLNPSNGYRASKTLAEKAAWKFVEEEKPNFSFVPFLSCLLSTLVFHPYL